MPEGHLSRTPGSPRSVAEGRFRSSLLNCRIPPGAKRRGERQSSPAAMERSGIAVRCSALLGADLPAEGGSNKRRARSLSLAIPLIVLSGATEVCLAQRHSGICPARSVHRADRQENRCLFPLRPTPRTQCPSRHNLRMEGHADD